MLDEKTKDRIAHEALPDEWYSRLEKCRTVDDLDNLRSQYAVAINANPDLQGLFTVYKMWLKHQYNKP